MAAIISTVGVTYYTANVEITTTVQLSPTFSTLLVYFHSLLLHTFQRQTQYLLLYYSIIQNTE